MLTDANNTLDEWQREEALNHWKRKFTVTLRLHGLTGAVMREILPDVLWETY